jgi:hypothetical protein
MRTILYALLFFTLFLQSCGPSRFVEPLKKKENAVSASLGGPMLNVPGVATMPIPFTSLTYGRGITNNITVFGSWYSTAAIFGNIQFDAGATMRIIESKNGKHGMSATGGFNFATDRWEWNSKIWPQLDVNYYWKYNQRFQVQDDLLTKGGTPTANLIYAGIGTWYELSGMRSHDVKQTTRVIPMLNIGHNLNGKKWTLTTEIKLIAPFSSNENIVVDYVSLTGKTGATGIYIGVTRRF